MVTALPNVQLQGKVSEFISKPRKMLINGKWVESASGKTFPTYDPSTGEVLAKVAEGDREDIDRAVKAARAAFAASDPISVTRPSRPLILPSTVLAACLSTPPYFGTVNVSSPMRMRPVPSRTK